MSLLRAAGISVDLPPGWDGGIAERAVLDDGAVRQSITHLASFPLPKQRGDYGGGAVNLMEWTDILIMLLEFDPDSTAQPLFAMKGLPRTLRPSDFGRHAATPIRRSGRMPALLPGGGEGVLPLGRTRIARRP